MTDDKRFARTRGETIRTIAAVYFIIVQTLILLHVYGVTD